MATHGTATNQQFTQVINPLNVATATALTGFEVKKVIKAFENDGAGLTAHMKLVMTAMTTGQQLVLQSATKKAPAATLLELVSTVSTAPTEKFVAADFFKAGTKNGVRIAWIGDNFNSKFGKKIEKNIVASTIRVHTLLKDSLDAPIITELGDTHETSLAELSQLLTAQGNGEDGTLLTNGYANIFYIRDIEGILWAVRALWRSGGWCVGAFSVERPRGWDAGRQVLSR